MSNLNADTLILVITRHCNLRCGYCQIEKTNKNMDFETAWRAVSLFLGGRKKKDKKAIRFFGGEPLLNFNLIKNLIIDTEKKYNYLNFNLTTNGVLLDRKIAGFFEKRPEIELIISSHQKKIFHNSLFVDTISRLPMVTVNLVLSPGRLNKAEDLMAFLLDKGVKRFNFLPAYYVFWSPNEIKLLRRTFKNIKNIISGDDKIYIKNFETFSSVPLFNAAPTIDYSGNIYAGNIFLDKRLTFWQDELKIGNIYNIKNWESLIKTPLSFDFSFFLKLAFTPGILKATEAADYELSRFIKSFHQ